MAQAYRAPKIHTKVIFTVPTFAKEDQRRRWWCSRPECCWSATADQDLKRHYKECHRHFVDAHEKVFAAEQATWVNAKYIDSRHAGDEEQHVVRTMARRKPRARLITKTQVVVEEGEGQGQLFKLPNTPSTAFITLRLPRSATIAAIKRLEQISEASDFAEWSSNDVLIHSGRIITDIGKALNGLRLLRKDEAVRGHTFETMLDQIVKSMTTLENLRQLVLHLTAEQSDNEEEGENEPYPRQVDDVDALMNGLADNNDRNGGEETELEITKTTSYVGLTHNLDPTEDNDLAIAPSFLEWTSAQMLLHAAELRYHAWDIRNDGQRGRATACERDATEWEAEGLRRKGLEDAGERTPWEWGCVHRGVERPWDWRLGSAIEQDARPEVGFLAKNEYDH